MGLLSLFSSRKGNAPAPERGRRSRSDPGAGIASSRRLAEEYADDTLDPEFPQKQRARRRLIGAVVLMAAAVIVLPIVFETQPRPVNDNISVKIDGGPGGAAGKVKPDARKADPLPPAPQSKLDSQALDAGEELVADSAAAKPAAAAVAATAAAAAPAEKIADKSAAAAAKPGSGKFLVLIGAFSSEEKAKSWLGKLKAGKVPAYIEKKVLADGERVLLRAGPFSDRDAADAAEKRVRAVGLTAKVVEQ